MASPGENSIAEVSTGATQLRDGSSPVIARAMMECSNRVNQPGLPVIALESHCTDHRRVRMPIDNKEGFLGISWRTLLPQEFDQKQTQMAPQAIGSPEQADIFFVSLRIGTAEIGESGHTFGRQNSDACRSRTNEDSLPFPFAKARARA